jgi:hypothetical protein
VDRLQTTPWQNRIGALAPNKWLFHLGSNDVGGGVTVQNNMQNMINVFKNSYGAAGSDIVLAVPANGISWQPTINNLITANALRPGPDFNAFYANHTNPTLKVGLHPNVAGHVEMARLWAISIMAPKNVAAQQVGPQVKVSWDDLRTIEPTISGYKVYYGTDPGNLNQSVDVGTATGAFISTPLPLQTYYFAVRAYDNDVYVPNLSAVSASIPLLVQ